MVLLVFIYNTVLVVYLQEQSKQNQIVTMSLFFLQKRCMFKSLK